MNASSRRDFLARLSASLAAAPLLAGSGQPLRLAAADGINAAPSNRLRLGVIGCGGMGRGDLATFLLYPDVECAVLCDVDDRMLAEAVKVVEEKGGRRPDTVKDFRRVLSRKDVDAVLVATPDHWHALASLYALQAGKDVYVEKPLATSIAEGKAMLEGARRYNRIAQMGAQRRSSPTYAEAVDFVRTGKLGTVGLVRAWAYLDWIKPIGNPPDAAVPEGVDYDLWLGPAPKRPFNPNRFHFNFRWFWDYAGGLMTDWGVHLLQVLLWGMGSDFPKAVTSSGGKYVLEDNSETPDTQMTIYEFPKYTMVWEHKVGIGLGLYNRPWGMAFIGTEATLVINDSGWEILREPSKDTVLAQKHAPGTDPRPAHVRNFLDSVKSRQQPVENLEIGHHLSTIAHLGNIALRSGERIRWDAEHQQVIGSAAAKELMSVRYRKPWRLPT